MATIAAKIGAQQVPKRTTILNLPCFHPIQILEGRREPNEDQGHVQGSNQDQ